MRIGSHWTTTGERYWTGPCSSETVANSPRTSPMLRFQAELKRKEEESERERELQEKRDEEQAEVGVATG